MIKKTLLLLLLIISISCSNDLKEEIGEEGFILGYEYETLLDKEIIQFSDFQNTILHKQKIKTNYLKNLLSLKSETKEISTNEIVIHIDTSKITKFVHPGYTTYTFKVVTTVPGGFDNLILVETETSLKEYVVKYKPSNGWTKSSGLPFTGGIEYLSERNLTKNSACVLTIEPIYSNCSAGNNHPPDGSGGSCTVGYGSLIGYNIYEGSGCSSGGDSGGDGSGPGDGSGTIGGGGGSGGDGPYYGEIPTDIDDDPIVLSAGMVFNYLGTSSVEYNWIMNSENYEDQQEIAEFLINNEHSEDARLFAKEAIRALTAGGQVDFEQRLINNPLLHDFLKDKMSQNEFALFNTLSTLQKGLYLRAAAEAYVYAEIFYSQPVRNRKGDAVKHALWNALSTNYIGANLTEQLTTAHEQIPYDYPNHFKETNMDLHNNQQGRLLQTQYGSIIFQLVENALANGVLKYLNNLEWSQSTNSWLATNTSQLIPTNQ